MKNDTISKILNISGLKSLNSMQKLAVEKGLLEGKNLVISSPTASGKTLLCELAGFNFFRRGVKMIYMGPLVALVSEKYSSFKKKYQREGIRIAMSVGGLDSSDSWLIDYDWILTSNEKMDSLLRHGANWLNDVGLIIVDEIHMLQDPSRGPTLEIVLTTLRKILPNAQIIGLSATIKNANELAEWLNAELVSSDYRPVKLYEGIFFDSKIQFYDKENYNFSEDLRPEARVFENTKKMKKQVLFFVSSRRNAESLSEKLSKFNKNSIDTQRKKKLKQLSLDLLNVLEIPTRQCKRLAACIKGGVAFHHAGLLYEQRKIIEEAFKKGNINAIAATPTLAYGVNLPAFRVVVRDIKRYYSGYGYRFIPVLEYKQFCGRAGRPQYDEFGESILIAKTEDVATELTDRYILGETEDILSKLALEPVLRMHILSIISSGLVKTKRQLMEFFGETFYAYKYGDISSLESKIEFILGLLRKFNFLIRKPDERLLATKMGKRVSELYIDPLTAHHFIKCLNKAQKIKTKPFSYLHMISNTLEMKPLLSIRNREFEEINDKIARSVFLQDIPGDWDLDFDEFLKSVKTASLLDEWSNEMTEDKILSKFKVRPGELRNRLNNADWLLYAAHEIALLLKFKKNLKDLRKVRVRIKYGVKEELIPLVRLEQIGRVRARKLYKNGLKSISDLKKIPVKILGKIVGPKIAVTIKRQLGQKVEKIKEEKQKTLSGFKGKSSSLV